MNGDSNTAAKKVFFCACTHVSPAGDGTVSMEFLWPGPAPRAGQFFLIRPRRTGVFLGRPISTAGWEPAGWKSGGEAGGDGGTLRFLVARKGRGSREITDMRPGEEAELTGPLGNWWAQKGIHPGFQPEENPGPVALVAGGIGIAPLLAFAQELSRGTVPGGRVFDFYAGFRTGSFSLEGIKPRSSVMATEDGSAGLKGRIPDFFTPSGYNAVFACGPEPMLKTVGDACIAAGIPCLVSMERHMACGTGACLGCTVKTLKGNRRCCADGPVFNVEEICFDR